MLELEVGLLQGVMLSDIELKKLHASKPKSMKSCWEPSSTEQNGLIATMERKHRMTNGLRRKFRPSFSRRFWSWKRSSPTLRVSSSHCGVAEVKSGDWEARGAEVF